MRHDAFYLLLCCAVGTKYENFVHHMVEIEVEYTHRFMDALDRLGPGNTPDGSAAGAYSGQRYVLRLLGSSFNVPLEQARGYVKELQEFYMAGWKKIMGLWAL